MIPIIRATNLNSFSRLKPNTAEKPSCESFASTSSVQVIKKIKVQTSMASPKNLKVFYSKEGLQNKKPSNSYTLLIFAKD